MSDEEETDKEYLPGFESDSEDDVELLSNMNKVVNNVCDKVTLAEAHLSDSEDENTHCFNIEDIQNEHNEERESLNEGFNKYLMFFFFIFFFDSFLESFFYYCKCSIT